MDAGKLDSLISISAYDPGAGEWATVRSVWAQKEKSAKTNVFSRIGFGTDTVKFVIRNTAITMHNAIQVDGYHHIITNIEEIDNRYLILTTAKVRLTEVSRGPDAGTFKAILTEKWNGYTIDAAKSTNEDRLVMVVPKAVTVAVNDVLTIAETYWYVEIQHELDEFKNEYEIVRRRDN